jgi:hypothetical protein
VGSTSPDAESEWVSDELASSDRPELTSARVVVRAAPRRRAAAPRESGHPAPPRAAPVARAQSAEHVLERTRLREREGEEGRGRERGRGREAREQRGGQRGRETFGLRELTQQLQQRL